MHPVAPVSLLLIPGHDLLLNLPFSYLYARPFKGFWLANHQADKHLQLGRDVFKSCKQLFPLHAQSLWIGGQLLPEST